MRQYQSDGLVDARLHPRIAASALGAMVEAFAKGMYMTGRSSGYDLDTVIEQLTLLWTNALGMPPRELGSVTSGKSDASASTKRR
jgi:hypothetical protein